MDWRNSLLVGGATFLVGAVLMEIGDKPKGDIGWWPYVGTFISGAVGFMLLTNEYTPKALELNNSAESFNGMTLNEWLDEIDRIKSTKEPFYYANEFLGSPKYGNGIDSFWEQGWSPQGILHVWKYYDNDTRYFEKSRAWKKMSAESFTAEEIILTADLWENEPHEKNWGIYDNDDDCVGEIVLTYNCYDSYSMTHGNTPYRESRKAYHFTIYADVDRQDCDKHGKTR